MDEQRARQLIVHPVVEAIENLQTAVEDGFGGVSDDFQTVNRRLDGIVDGLQQEGVDAEARSEFPWKFSATVPADTGAADPETVVHTIGVDGEIVGFEAVSSQAAQQAVGVQFGAKAGERYAPRNPDIDSTDDDEYLGVDDHPITAQPNVRVSEGDKLIVKYINNDTNNSHYVRTQVRIRED